MKKMTKTFRIVIDGVEYHVDVEELSSGNTGVTTTAPRTAPAPVATSTPAPQPAPSAPAAPTAPAAPAARPAAAGGEAVLAPLQGKIWDVPVTSGDSVKAGDTLVVIEAMKMENEIVAPHDAVVGDIHVKKGDAVKSGDLLINLQ
jgi:glutaconyl-CoA decarboxylase